MTELDGEHPSAIPDSPLSANMPHRPADDSEEVYFEGSPMVRGALGKNLSWVLLGLAMILAPIVINLVFKRTLPTWLFAALMAFGLLIVCLPPLRALTIRFKVTNYRIDYERGLIGKDIDTLELWHIEDIHYHQTIRDRLLGIGTITVISHDLTTPRLIMHSLPNSRHLFEQLKQRIIAVKRQRGVLKVDTGN